MDKHFLLEYTETGYDGFRHACHAWFETEGEMQSFVEGARKKQTAVEIDFAIEITAYRNILLK